jgi:hypothetical protein
MGGVAARFFSSTSEPATGGRGRRGLRPTVLLGEVGGTAFRGETRRGSANPGRRDRDAGRVRLGRGARVCVKRTRRVTGAGVPLGAEAPLAPVGPAGEGVGETGTVAVGLTVAVVLRRDPQGSWALARSFKAQQLVRSASENLRSDCKQPSRA